MVVFAGNVCVGQCNETFTDFFLIKHVRSREESSKTHD